MPAVELNYITFKAAMGWIGILSSAKGLLRTTLPQRTVQEARQLLGDGANHATWAPRLFEDLMERLSQNRVQCHSILTVNAFCSIISSSQGRL